MLSDIITHVREDVLKVDEKRAQVLFEVTAEVLSGLRLAYEHYESGTEPGMKRDVRAPDSLSTPLE